MNKFMNRLLRDVKRSKDLKTMEALYKGSPNDSVVKFEYAKMLIYYGHYVKARQLLTELLDSRNADYAMLELGISEKLVGNVEKAKEYFEILAAKHDEAAIFELARLEAGLGNIERGKELLRSIINNNPENYARVELGKLEASSGNIELAKQYFLDAYKYQKLPAGKVALGRLAKALKNYDEARKQFESVINVDQDISGKFELGKLELSLGNIDKARKIFDDLYNIDKILAAKLELGKLEYILGNYEKAVQLFLELEGTRIERFAYFQLIIISIKRKDYDSAFKYCKKTLDKGNWIDPTLAIDVSKHLNIFLDTNYDEFVYNYTINQLIDYDPYIAMEHITRRHHKSNQSDFREGIDVYKLFNEVSEQLTEENRLKVVGYNDIYVIPYDNIGADGENYLKVVTLPNSKDIITMFPDFSSYDSYKYLMNNNPESELELTRELQ